MTLNFLRREVGNQILYDKVLGSGPNLNKPQPNKPGLEEVIHELNSEELLKIDEDITTYVSFIKTNPEANQENYKQQEQLRSNIDDYVQAHIIPFEEEDMQEYATNLQEAFNNLQGKHCFLEELPGTNNHVLGTDQGELLNLNELQTTKLPEEIISADEQLIHAKRYKNELFVVIGDKKLRTKTVYNLTTNKVDEQKTSHLPRYGSFLHELEGDLFVDLQACLVSLTTGNTIHKTLGTPKMQATINGVQATFTYVGEPELRFVGGYCYSGEYKDI